MRSCQFLCILLAILVSGCASWHKPSLVYRGRPSMTRHARHEKVGESRGVGIVFGAGEDADEADTFPGDSDTVTPPIEGKAHRSRYRPLRSPEQEAAEQRLRETRPDNPPPDEGYLELPPPPESKPSGNIRLGRLNRPS